MATLAHPFPKSSAAGSGWLWALLRDELAPFPGRLALVARMVTASTLMMILCMTFRIPYGAYAALFALIISRESLRGTADATRDFVIGSVIAGAYAVLGALLVVGNAMLRFLWVSATLFLVFYVVSALSSYTAAARFSYVAVITIPLWDSNISAEAKLESTLWAVGVITIATIITLLMEIAFAALRGANDLVDGITQRLHSVEEFLTHYLDGGRSSASSAVVRLATLGTSGLRRTLRRSGYHQQHEQQMSAVVSLTGRVVDIAANLPSAPAVLSVNDRARIGRIAAELAAIRTALQHGAVPSLPQPAIPEPSMDAATSAIPFLGELEKTVSLIPQAFAGAQSLSIYALPHGGVKLRTPLAANALANPEHLRFALRGSLAAGLCYVIYNGLFWPGIATSLVTCLLTALTTIGASHQKQFLRFAGALIGGVGIGMGAQVFILPHMDSIASFTLLFVAVAGLSAWIATSGPRISYLGIQIAVAFCLINLQEFKFQTSLAIARDRVAGIFLGLFMMWLVFDRLWAAPAGVAMKKTLAANLRLLAQLAREPVSDVPPALFPAFTERNSALRETINANFDTVRSLADGILFEFGPSRQQDLALRDQFRRWQPRLRTLFVMRIASLKYRLQLPGFELPEPVGTALTAYDRHAAQMLERMADRIEGSTQPPRLEPMPDAPAASFARLEESATAALHACTPGIPSFLTLMRGVDSVMGALAQEIAGSGDNTITP